MVYFDWMVCRVMHIFQSSLGQCFVEVSVRDKKTHCLSILVLERSFCFAERACRLAGRRVLGHTLPRKQRHTRFSPLFTWSAYLPHFVAQAVDGT